MKKPRPTVKEMRHFIHAYTRNGSPTCVCFGCKFAREWAYRYGVKIETVKQWEKRMGAICRASLKAVRAK